MKKIIIRDVDVIESWETDYGDYRARVKLKENNKEIGELVVTYEWHKIVDVVGKKEEKITKKEIEMAIAVLVLNEDFETYKAIPKLSQCSQNLQMLYECVCMSDSSMCFIEEEDRDEIWSDENIELLKKEVKKYGLDGIIRFGEDDCLVTAYGDLELCFIDDGGLNND